MKKKILSTLETFSRAMLSPLMYLSAGGMIMVIGVLMTNSTITSFLPFLKWGPIQTIGTLIYQCIMLIINNLCVVFAVGIPAAMAKKEKHQAALIGLMSYLMYLETSNVLLSASGKLADSSGMLGLIGTGQTEILGIQCIDMSVFGGILLGCITGYVFNRTCNKQFGGALQIYSGVRFSFVCMIFVSMIFGAISNAVWPIVQNGISALATFIESSGAFGLFLYGFLERLLIPTGLHHLIYTPFQFTSLGGTLTIGDTVYSGAYAIAMAELNMPVERLSPSIYYMAIGFTKMFGYIGIGAAFIHTAYKENKKRVTAQIVPLVITACLASVTEPLDFMFIFCAPVLYIAHALIAGTFIALLKIFDVTAFCGGNLLVSLLLNISAGVSKTHWPTMVALGIVEILVYFVLFSFLIKKFNYKTPGREDADMSEDAVAPQDNHAVPVVEAVTAQQKTSDNKNNTFSENIPNLVAGLGGKDNINTVENCFTRLRINVKDINKIDKDQINKISNSGIVVKGDDIQVIYGLQVPEICNAVTEYLKLN